MGPLGPQSHDGWSGGWAEPLLLEMSRVHPESPTRPFLGGTEKSPHTHLGSSCPQSRSELHTMVFTKLITAGLGIYFFKKTFSRGRNTQEL